MSISPQLDLPRKPPCPHCGGEVPRRTGPGRPRKFCTAECSENARRVGPRTLAERFWGKVDKSGPMPLVKSADGRELGNCWIWGGSCSPYGALHIDGRYRGAHRIAYEMEHGPIPAGLHVDHLCRRPACVRPWHLDPVTPRVNLRRGIGPQAQNAKKTHCHRGHEFSPENTYVSPRETRHCRICMSIKRWESEDRRGVVRNRRSVDPRLGGVPRRISRRMQP